MSDGAPHARPGASTVLAVVVARGTSPHLTETLRGLAQQSRLPGEILLVDVAPVLEAEPVSPDAAEVAAFAARGSHLYRVPVPDAETFGEAVALGLAAVPEVSTTWLWLLHDDSAPDPAALAMLVRAVELAPSVVVAGVKQRQWANPTRLVEVGVTTSRFGRRITGVEPDEVDQGQHDGRDDVLAVGLAGALVRRDVWDAVGGTDPGFGMFGDGYDFCRRVRLAGHRVVVVPAATVRHAQLALHGVRSVRSSLGHESENLNGPDDVLDPERGAEPESVPEAEDLRRSFRARRQSLVYGQLVSVPSVLVPLVAFLGLGAGLGRAVVRLLTKEPGLALAELSAPVGALARPGQVARARSSARGSRRLPRRALRPLQTSARDVLREARDRRLAATEERRTAQARSELEMAELSELGRRRRTGLAVVLAVVLAGTLVAFAPLIGRLWSGDVLAGGALLPSSATFADLYRAVTSGWVATGLGQSGPADPLLVVLLPLTALTRSVTAATGLVLLSSPVLAAWGAWAAAGAATRSIVVRAWAAVVWAAAPSLLLAVSGGRLGAVLAHLALPWLVLGVARALGVARRDVIAPALVAAPDQGEAAPSERTDARGGSITAAAGAALAFVVVAAGAPVLLVVLTVLLAILAVVVRRHRGRIALIPVPALILFGPLITEALSAHGAGAWRVLLADPGVPVDSALPPAWQLVLGWPAAPPVASALVDPLSTALPLIAGIVLLGLALGALFRGRAVASGVRTGWLVAAAGLITAALSGRVAVGLGPDAVVHGWPGAGISVMTGGLLAAAVLGMDGLQTRLARYTFGWRQGAGAMAAVVAIIAPMCVGGVWAWQQRTQPSEVALHVVGPAVVPLAGRQSELSTNRQRVLGLSVDPDGTVRYRVYRAVGPELIESSTAVAARGLTGSLTSSAPAPRDDAEQALDQAVAELSAGTDTDVSELLGQFAIGAVIVSPPDPDAAAAGSTQLVARLDSTLGLERITQGETGALWRVSSYRVGEPEEVVAARVRIFAGPLAEDPGPGVPVAPVDSGPVEAESVVPAGEPTRIVVLAERSDPAWRAQLDGQPLRAVAVGWRQAFELGADGGTLTIDYAPFLRIPWLVAQAAALLVTLLLAIPLRRPRGARW